LQAMPHNLSVRRAGWQHYWKNTLRTTSGMRLLPVWKRWITRMN